MPQLRAALVAMLGTVPGIGHVHDRERYVRDATALKALYVDAGQLRGWWVRRVETERRAINMARNRTVHTWQIRGYMALDDAGASEIAFDALIERIAQAYDADPTLGGLVQEAPLAADSLRGIQVADVGPVMFSGVLSHSAVLQLKTWSYS
ncbi:hypothetical protein ISF6_5335 [Piscinibacter sakaiensis]|uniref:Phage protein n=1 Tax=Piscinibacter sakaiensis TaxID=1547922 RepID=A0A0K8P822_PISS1|nr:hypothetical protein ISF6_5335 [Piscinibacter sakaiensis]